MISVNKAEGLILKHSIDFGNEKVKLADSFGRVISLPIKADRDYPPFNRATMDGIAISYEAFKNGSRNFDIKGTLLAGQKPVEIDKPNQCVKIMTGASLPNSTDTVVPIEELAFNKNSVHIISKSIKKGQFIHRKGSDNKNGEVILKQETKITSEILPILASVGFEYINVKKLPKTVIITTGDELVNVNRKPSEFQIRRSNDQAMKAVLHSYRIEADVINLDDKKELILNTLKKCIKENDVILISGGVSKGETDFVKLALNELKVKNIFHGISQRPGKPMFFGKHSNEALIFAFPGNPVSTFLCLCRYFIPWLEASFGLNKKPKIYAALGNEISGNSSLTQFIQVKIHSNIKGQLIAKSISQNGSGDFISLSKADAFIELPKSKSAFKKGSIHRIWKYKEL